MPKKCIEQPGQPGRMAFMDKSGISGNLENETILENFLKTRRMTVEMCEPLERDDFMVQSTPDTSPPKWHLGHTTWFFEKFILRPFSRNYRAFDTKFDYIFNSYYETVGEYVPKPSRSTISRPSLETVLDYRKHVEGAMESLLNEHGENRDIMGRAVLGVNHEQQHQELLLMDIKRNLYQSPYRPAYAKGKKPVSPGAKAQFIQFPEQTALVGHQGNGFSFDNETPPHRELVSSFSISNRPVTNGDFIRFVEDGGYRKPDLWLSMGWGWRLSNSIEMPLYWEKESGNYRYFTLYGMQDIDPDEPAMHISYYEADAFARWANAKLPTEPQWEVAMGSSPLEEENFLETGNYSPTGSRESDGIAGIGNVWEWTLSAYLPYPGFRPLEGSLGEYNGKFMSGQMVLKGASFSTPKGHSRKSYRNFYAPGSRWQFSGLRLARDGLNGQ